MTSAPPIEWELSSADRLPKNQTVKCIIEVTARVEIFSAKIG